jgi:hypothetical protein
MPDNKCFSLIRGRAMRVTRLDGCGAVVPGADSSVVSDGFITVGLTANTDEGTTISVTNAAGKICILDEPCPVFTGYDVTVEFCGVSPALIQLMTGQQPVADEDGNSVGFRMNSGIDACKSGFALEVWSNVPTAVCEPGAGETYGYFLVPFLRGGVLGDFTIGNDAVNFTLSGAGSRDGSAWGTGPYDVVSGSTGPAPLLDPIDSKDHLHIQLTTVPPPDPDCNPLAVGEAADGATAGTPGDWTPANTYGPETLTDLQASGVTASPNTAWTTGQYVTLGDGSQAHWTGTAWAEGTAP